MVTTTRSQRRHLPHKIRPTSRIRRGVQQESGGMLSHRRSARGSRRVEHGKLGNRLSVSLLRPEAHGWAGIQLREERGSIQPPWLDPPPPAKRAQLTGSPKILARRIPRPRR